MKIVTYKHPVMVDRLDDVRNTLIDPNEIRVSRTDPSVYLFYKKSEHRWTCVVANALDWSGFVITCYVTDALKEGTSLWSK